MNLLVTGGVNTNFGKRNFTGIEPSAITLIVPDFFNPIPENTTEITFQATGIPGGTAKAKYNSYQLTPHIDLNYEFNFKNFSLIPFISSDCNITFQDRFQEYGGGKFVFSACNTSINFDQIIDQLTTFLLQNEIGINFYEQIDLKKNGLLVFREKTSYVNRYTIPYYLYSKQVGDLKFQKNYIDYPMEHFFGSSAEIIYRIKNTSLIFTYEGLLGSGFVSNAIFGRISQDF